MSGGLAPPPAERPDAARRLGVRAVRSVTPRLRRVTLACDEPGLYAGSAMHVRLLVPCPCGTLRGADGAAAAARYYTVRQIRPETGEIDIDVVLHEPCGPGSRWGARAGPGDRVALIGPLGRPVPATGPLVLVGDETALPVIARLIEEAAPDRRIRALVEVADAEEEQPVACGAGTDLAFLHRRPGAPARLAEAAADLDWRADDDLFVYAGVEAATARALTGLLRDRLPQAIARQRIIAYWRRETER